MYCLMNGGIETFIRNGTVLSMIYWSQSITAQEKSSIFAYVHCMYESYASYCVVICVWYQCLKQ